ncbi:MAG: hypothetical protein CFK52_12745 [Chloracidobacterium sp. CP2_5A]|nr:MAG: hypothetical protein CFK52_12745 [Chloracidobacterium sp. CP2_5A]
MPRLWVLGQTRWAATALAALLLGFAGAAPAGAQVATGASTKITKVKRALTGDTVMLDDGAIVRLIGILAPPSGPAAEQARARAQQLILDKTVEVWLENQNQDIGHRDQYGRQLSYIYLLPSRKMLNAELIRDGDAFFFSQHLMSLRAKNILLAAEYQARQAKRGIWAQATESPEAIAKREGRVYEEPAFTVPEDADVTDSASQAVQVNNQPDGAGAAPSAPGREPPPLDAKATYGNIRVESCAVLDVPGLGPVALIGVQNNTGKSGEAARVEVAKLVQGKRLRFEYDPVNAARGHQDRDGRRLVYAFLPDGALLNLQVVARGIADVDIDYDFKHKTSMLTARDSARLNETGPRWRNDIPRRVSLDRIRASIVQAMSEQFGRAGARIELIGDEGNILRISHDLIDQSSAEQLYKVLAISEGGNLPLLRSSGIQEIQFTDAKATKIFRFPL